MKPSSFIFQSIRCFILIPALLLNCASVKHNNKIALVSRYPGAGTLSLFEGSLQDGLEYQFRVFEDTTSKDTITYLWNLCRKQLSESSFHAGSEPLIQNLTVYTGVLKFRGYNSATIQPCTYESIYALSKLPLLIWTLIIHHPDKKSNFITDKTLSIEKASILEPYAENIQLHLISMIDKSGNIYKIEMHDGIVLEGTATDILNAQIVSGEQSTSPKYLQVVDCFFVTLLPVLELNEHINEWYKSLPYDYKKPEIQELK